MRKIHKNLATALVGLFILFIASPVLAERNVYEANQPLEKIVPKLIDELGNAGFQYDVKKVYNADQDGREGMILRFKPSGILCEFIFIQDRKNRNRSLIKVQTFDRGELRRLHRFFLANMHMTHSGVRKLPG